MITSISEHRLQQTFWHQMDARWRLVGVCLALIGIAIQSKLFTVGLSLIGIMALLLSCRIDFWKMTNRLIGPFLFLSIGAGIIAFSIPEGVSFGLLLLLKGIASLLLVYFLIDSGSLESQVHAAQGLGLPSIVTSLSFITIRYLMVMFDVLASARRGLRTRGYKRTFTLRGYQVTSRVLGTILIQGLTQADRVTHAMRCRGYSGKLRFIQSWPPFQFLYPVGTLLLCMMTWLPFFIEKIIG